MGLFDKFKKKSFNENTIKTSKIKWFNEKLAKEIAKQEVQTIEEAQPLSTIDKTKTLYRLDVLEDWVVVYAPKINDNTINVNALRLQHNNDIQRLEALINGNKPNELKADVVKDTTDNQYKNVKQIIIDKAINANQILYNGNYTTIENVMQNYKPEPPKEVDYAKESGVARKVWSKSGVHDIDNILLDYLTKNDWGDVIRQAETFEQFKTNLLNKLALGGRR